MQLRSVNINDAKLLFDWANDDMVRANAFTPEKIEWENHIEWFKKKLKSNKTKLYILEIDNKPVGQIRLDFEADCWLIDYSIERNERGKGYGKLIIREATAINENMKLKAIVKSSNTSSQKIFKRLGFVNISNNKNYTTFILNPPNFNS